MSGELFACLVPLAGVLSGVFLIGAVVSRSVLPKATPGRFEELCGIFYAARKRAWNGEGYEVSLDTTGFSKGDMYWLHSTAEYYGFRILGEDGKVRTYRKKEDA